MKIDVSKEIEVLQKINGLDDNDTIGVVYEYNGSAGRSTIETIRGRVLNYNLATITLGVSCDIVVVPLRRIKDIERK